MSVIFIGDGGICPLILIEETLLLLLRAAIGRLKTKLSIGGVRFESQTFDILTIR